MRVISPLDLRRSLGAILDAASAGERFVIERDRRPLAMLVSVEDGRRLEPDADEVRRRRLAAIDRLEALARREAAAGPPRSPQAPGTIASSPAPRPDPAVEPASGLRPAPPAPPPAGAKPRSDPHLAERRRHAGEGLVGLE